MILIVNAYKLINLELFIFLSDGNESYDRQVHTALSPAPGQIRDISCWTENNDVPSQ